MQPSRKENGNIRVLIIDDDEDMRSLLRELLEEDGFKTESSGNGCEALQVLTRRPFDLIITDVEMRGLTGLDILPEIKKLRPDASIIVMSSFAGTEVRRRSFEKGASAYLEKPVHMKKLKALIHEMLSTKQRARASPGSR